eukprot:NODE_252_length_2204_cov_68.771786_g246_i0.p1 GENE.NODE_252_length_2204_cov_68.771786_g246_i0~~NODE_252_length_2204_cov_68.771786_g246_i0.p1  ORF type:complete len:572 (+),score=77.65 NODE_252_length_2204_cov_68.771786_g246_i0:83-1798(+)
MGATGSRETVEQFVQEVANSPPDVPSSHAHTLHAHLLTLPVAEQLEFNTTICCPNVGVNLFFHNLFLTIGARSVPLRGRLSSLDLLLHILDHEETDLTEEQARMCVTDDCARCCTVLLSDVLEENLGNTDDEQGSPLERALNIVQVLSQHNKFTVDFVRHEGHALLNTAMVSNSSDHCKVLSAVSLAQIFGHTKATLVCTAPHVSLLVKLLQHSDATIRVAASSILGAYVSGPSNLRCLAQNGIFPAVIRTYKHFKKVTPPSQCALLLKYTSELVSDETAVQFPSVGLELMLNVLERQRILHAQQRQPLIMYYASTVLFRLSLCTYVHKALVQGGVVAAVAKVVCCETTSAESHKTVTQSRVTLAKALRNLTRTKSLTPKVALVELPQFPDLLLQVHRETHVQLRMQLLHVMCNCAVVTADDKFTPIAESLMQSGAMVASASLALLQDGSQLHSGAVILGLSCRLLTQVATSTRNPGAVREAISRITTPLLQCSQSVPLQQPDAHWIGQLLYSVGLTGVCIISTWFHMCRRRDTTDNFYRVLLLVHCLSCTLVSWCKGTCTCHTELGKGIN